MNHSAREHVGWALALALVSCFPALPADALEWGTHVVAFGSQWTKDEPPRWSASQALGSLQIQHAAAVYSGDAIQLNGDSTEIGELAGSVCPPQCYVSPIGSDTNSGSSSAPWRTINKAASVASAGTTVHVAPGVYAERVRSNRSGTASARIRFVSDVRWAAKITPTGTGTGGWGGSYGWRNTGSYVEINGFEITPARGASMDSGIYLPSGKNIWALNNKIHHVSVNGMPEGPGGISNDLGTDNIYYIGNLLYDIGYTQRTHGIYCASGICQIINNVIGNVSGYGVSLWHTPHDVLIYNNTIFNSGMRGHYSSGGILVGAGEHPGADARNCIVSNNIVYGSPSFGIMEGGTTHNNKFINNLTYNNYRNWGLQNGTQSGTVSADPKFVNYKIDGTGNYRLQPSSPAIEKALARYAPAIDFDGYNRRTGGAPDIGAFEWHR